MAIDKLTTSDPEALDFFGISVAIDGDYLVAGAWWEDNDPPVNSAGAAYIFKKDDMGNWEETVKLTSPNPEPLGYFGFSVAIDGDYIAVGTYNEDEDIGGGTVFGNAGAVYIYQLQPNGEWLMMQRLVSDDPDDGDLFGYSVALSGDYLLVGAWNEDHDANGNNTMSSAGSAFVFERQPNETWNLVEKLVASDRAPGDEFGKQVDIRGERAIIGAANKDDLPNFFFEAGAAYIFERNNSTGAWTETQKLLAADRSFYDSFGSDVAIDGDKAWVGAVSEADIPGGGTASGTGAAYFFERNATGIWEETQKVYALDHSQGDAFGGTLDLSGNIVVIGAASEDEDESGGNTVVNAGSAYILERQPNGVWQQVQKIIGQTRGPDDMFGSAISVRHDQTVIGARNVDDSIGQNLVLDVGAVFVFKRDVPLSNRETAQDLAIRIAPNPSLGLLGVLNSSDKIMDLQLVVYDLFGNKVFENDFTLADYHQEHLFGLPAGMYLVFLTNEQAACKILKWMKL